jgi:KipI family sensor histidine kinase inhibitor
LARRNIAPLGVVPLGDSAAYVEFSATLDLDVNSVVQRLGLVILKRAVPWVRDVVPALGGLALHFDPDHAEFPANPLDQALALVNDSMKQALSAKDNPGSEVELPVCYEPEFALDLNEVGKKAELPPEEVAARHAAAEYRVLMMGFAPGHAYMGGLDPKLAVPRRSSPRAVVPAGSVAIANEQTVVYPYAISGGWNVIGRTPMVLFDASRQRPSLLWPGDRVRFRAITRAQFIAMATAQ